MKFKQSVMVMFFFAGSLLCLNACEEKRTESYYFTRPEVLKTFLRQCQEEQGAPENFNASCVVAYKAAVQMTRLSRAFVDNQTNFGQRILHAQIRVAKIEKQLKIAEEAHLPLVELKGQLKRETQQVSKLRAIVGLFIQV